MNGTPDGKVAYSLKEAGKQKKWEIKYQSSAESEATVARLSRELGCSPTMARLLLLRGCSTPEAVRSFLALEETCLHDPFGLTDMQAAVDRIDLALARGERIAIYGDYDVDGVTSVSLLYLYLSSLGADVGYYIPCRATEGYGVSASAIDTLHAKGVRLMITVDTGITAIEEIAYAKQLGIDTVVTDHHECRPELPGAVAVVNPHRSDDTYPFKELCGVGVIFKVVLAHAMQCARRDGVSEEDAVRRICRSYADIVAIGTVADVMPIADENRLIVKLGLGLLEHTERPGLRALMEAASSKNGEGKSASRKKRKINSGYIGFVIAPRMNAAGRVKHAGTAVELLLEEDPERAEVLAEELCRLNSERQVEENRIAEEAYRMLEEMSGRRHDRVIVLAEDSWQQGIIGIVSSRITERYGLPSILISFDGAGRGYSSPEDVGKGSGRSVKGLNLVEALSDCEELLVRFGGHELAAGLSVRRRDVDAFRERINAYAETHLTDEALCPSLEVDCEVEMGELSLTLVEEIDRLEPFGNTNEQPSLMLCDARILHLQPLGGGKHTKLLLEKDGMTVSAIWFGAHTHSLPFSVGDRVDLVFQVNANEFRGEVSLQLILQDMHLSPDFEAKICRTRDRYHEILNGAAFALSEDIIPTREEMGRVYRLLRRECLLEKHTVFPIRRLMSLLEREGLPSPGYIKLRVILSVMEELHFCTVTEAGTDCFVFDFEADPEKNSLENSALLHRLRAGLRGETEDSSGKAW